MINLLAIIGAIVGIVGGIIGFVSTLLPMWESRLKIKIELIPKSSFIYHLEKDCFDFDIGLMRDIPSIDFIPILAVDACFINLSNVERVVYSIKLICDYKGYRQLELDMLHKESERYEFTNSGPTKENSAVLPFGINSNSAVLKSIYFELPELCDIHNLDTYTNCKIEVRCQGKSFTSKTFQPKPLSDLSNL